MSWENYGDGAKVTVIKFSKNELTKMYLIIQNALNILSIINALPTGKFRINGKNMT